MANIRQLQRHCRRLLECYRQAKIAQSRIEELCSDTLDSLSDIIGLDTLALERTDDIYYLHAAVISRCILVQKELKATTTFKTNGEPAYEKAVFYAQRMAGVAGWKSSSLLSKCQMDHTIKNTSLVVSIRNPGIFLQSPLFLSICEFVGHDLMLNILLSYRMLVPAFIFDISGKVGCTYIDGKGMLTEDTDVIRGILFGILHRMDALSLDIAKVKVPSRPFIFIQCSGSVLYDDNLRAQHQEKTWSNITLSRHTILYKDSFNRRFGFLASDLLGAAISSFPQRHRVRSCYKDSQVTGAVISSYDNKQDDLLNTDLQPDDGSCAPKSQKAYNMRPKPCGVAINHLNTWRILEFVLFSRDFVNSSFGERRKAVKLFVENIATTTSKVVKWRKGSMLYGLYRIFIVFLQNVADFDIRKAYWLNFRHVKPHSSALECGLDPESVVRFVHQVVDEIVPCDLVGCRANYYRLKEVCRSMVIMNKGEHLEMSQVMKGFKARGCNWSRGCNGRLTKSQTRTILGYICRIVFFLLEHVVIPLLQRHFYITETNFTMYRLLYFRKADWYRMVMTENASYLSNAHFSNSSNMAETFARSDSKQSDAINSTASRDTSNVTVDVKPNYLRVRWLPKLSGMRPILNCNAAVIRKAGVTKCCSYNDMMEMPFHALTANIRMNPRLLGNGVLGYTGAFRFLKDWWIRFKRLFKLRNYKGDYLRLHIILADVSRCYESIPHKYLLETIKQLQLHGPLQFKRIYRRDLIHVASFPNSYSRRVTVLTENPSFPSFIETASLVSRSFGQFCVCSRHANDYFSHMVSKGDIISAVKALLSQFQISLPKISPQVLIRRAVGIPQGCCISPLLCSLFFAQGDMDSNVERLTTPSQGNLFLRWIDDFIFISTSADDANDMMRILSTNSAFGVAINEKCSIMHVDIPLSKNGFSVQAVQSSSSHRNVHSEDMFKNITTNCRATVDGISGWNACGSTPSTMECSEPLWINSTFEFDVIKGNLNATLKPWKNYHSTIRDSLSLSRMGFSTFMFAFLEQRLLGYLSNRLQHGLFTSVKLNSLRCILQNSYIAMRICVMKMQCATSTLIQHFGGFINCSYFGRLAHKLVAHAVLLVSRGGLDVRQKSVRRVLQLAVIYTFSPHWLPRLSHTFGRRRIRFICSIERKLKGQWPLQSDECMSLWNG